ncbi:hypothetical protein CVT26_013998 [Gymnopilus dilepis]|uniref:Uncharacterized protein n=1 Tax=Gymnopilus dilepis TaxID=231916 RepID=A0A409VW61_9AGAR|nr:hypothetical protein CVT26_013998 [Gymnopilus dilepis]
MRTRSSPLTSYNLDAGLLSHPSEVEAQRAEIEKDDHHIQEEECKRDDSDSDYQYESQASTDYTYSQSSQETWHGSDDGLSGSQSQGSFYSSYTDLTGGHDAIVDTIQYHEETQEPPAYSAPPDGQCYEYSFHQSTAGDEDADRPYPDRAPTPEFVPSSQTWSATSENFEGYSARAPPTPRYEPASQEDESQCSFCSTPRRANTPAWHPPSPTISRSVLPLSYVRTSD